MSSTMLDFWPMNSKLLTTVEVADKIGVPRATLQYWIKQGKLKAPKTRLQNGRAVRLWTASNVEEAKELKGTLKRGPEPRAKRA